MGKTGLVSGEKNGWVNLDDVTILWATCTYSGEWERWWHWENGQQVPNEYVIKNR